MSERVAIKEEIGHNEQEEMNKFERSPWTKDD